VAATLGRETLEAARAGLMEIQHLLRLAERSLAEANPRAVQDTTQAQGDIAQAVRRMSNVLLELHLDRLVAVEGWEHPSQVLERPRPELDALLTACEQRIRKKPRGLPPEQTRRLELVRNKLERAQRIAKSARQRRIRRSGNP
jgi:hypothetical protein